MNFKAIAERIDQIRQFMPDVDHLPIRFQGGQGGVELINVEGIGLDRELVFYTGRY